MFFRENRVVSIAVLLCAYVWNECFGIIYLFYCYEKANAVFYQFWDNSIAAEYFPVLYVRADRRRTGLARLYARGI